MANDNILFRDYAAWKLENVEVLEKFKENSSILYERLEPVYVVLENIYDKVCDSCELDEDYMTIFQVGFNYLNTQFEVLKIYFETLFDSKCDNFVEYNEMLLYLLYLNDVRTDLESNGLDSGYDALNEVETCIENMIMEKRKDFDYMKDMVNKALKSVFDTLEYDYVSIVDIYVEIAESLGIYLYENDDLVLGKDI